MVALGLESVLGTDNAASTGNSPALAKTKVRKERRMFFQRKDKEKKKERSSDLEWLESADGRNRREPARCGLFSRPSPPPKRGLRFVLHPRRSERGNAAARKPGARVEERKAFVEKSSGREKKGAAIEEDESAFFFLSTVAAPRSSFLFAHDTPLCYLLTILEKTKPKK